MRCPTCQKGRMFRSKQKNIEKLIYSKLGLYPWRCAACMSRKMMRAREEQQSKPSAIWMG